jgi:hypothetical protein
MPVSPTVFPGRLVISDEGGPIVHIDMYRANELLHLRIGVTRETLLRYAQRMLEAGNRYSGELNVPK